MYVDKGVHVSLDVISAYYNDFTWWLQPKLQYYEVFNVIQDILNEQ